MKILALFLTIFFASCSSVSITERKQLIILGDDVIYPQAFKAYKDFKSKAKLIEDGEDLENINKVTEKLKLAIKKYYQSINAKDPTSNFAWDVILVDDEDTKNAWCMPGGKIAVYKGILKIANNESALAALMGHEIAHAVARHGSERASQGVLFDIGTMALEQIIIGRPLTGDTRKLYNYFATFGVMLPFSRNHESEADYLGLIFMHFAGYDLSEAYMMWERMDKSNSRNRTPEFLSTHPSSKTRINNIKKWIPEVKEKYSSY
ncbi:MAG: peptidase M48 [Rickettsiales bacterium]|nr:peptidase M48 [Rickettsiales bacterium]